MYINIIHAHPILPEDFQQHEKNAQQNHWSWEQFSSDLSVHILSADYSFFLGNNIHGLYGILCI